MKSSHNILDKEYHLENVDSIYDEISSMDFNKTISEQVNRLDEDLFQLTFSDGTVIDIGWLPSFEESGQFVIQVISDGDWDNPTVKYFSGWDKTELVKKLDAALGA
ncbi:hypothetical protein [Erwinia billingiae]|jgi:hypothetical protein|uniref:hypothetical protein n=1 Tax=Erwinia billingiae TaxID=182337 RepID=UPI000CFF7A0C|nr:hypothetical protein [Erwinia billingiae]PRB58083.1 hypothetical protein CQ001_16240 [Erwinia billingiae]